MSATPYLRAPYIAEAQAQKHVTANNATLLADLARPRHALSASTPTPPASPAEGDAYILPATASGWTSATPPAGDPGPGDIAIRHAGAWHRIAPAIGWRWHVADLGGAMIYTAAGWRAGDVAAPLGASLGLVVRETALDLTGASVTAAGLIPTRAIVLGVTSWTITEITGPTGYEVGIAGETDKFGAALGLAVAASNVGVVGPFATYAPDDVIVTAAGGTFTAGRVGLAVSALVPRAPV